MIRGKPQIEGVRRAGGPRFGRIGPLSCVLFAPLALGACASGAGMTGSSLTAIDKAFLAAAPSWDIDRDGVVTCQDWTAYLTSLFQAADRNRDGLVTPDEFKSFADTDRLFVTANFAYWDDRKQGRVALADMIAKPNPAFQIVDRNKDCRLDSLEVLAAESAGERKRSAYRVPDPDGGDPRKGGVGN